MYLHHTHFHASPAGMFFLGYYLHTLIILYQKMNSTRTAILKRLHDVLGLPSHHDELTRESQYPTASRGFGPLFRKAEVGVFIQTGSYVPLILQTTHH